MNLPFELLRAEAVRLLAEKGIPSWKRVPAFYRFVWSCGIKLRPPHFASWEANFFFFGGIAGGFVTIGTWLTITAFGLEAALLQSLAAGVTVGVTCGFVEAARHKREAEDHGLPRWDDLPDVADVFD